MNVKRKIEIFSAGCAICNDTVQLVNELACPSCEVEVLDMKESKVAVRAKGLGIRSLPAVLVNGELAGCCAGRGPNAESLRTAGIGQPV